MGTSRAKKSRIVECGYCGQKRAVLSGAYLRSLRERAGHSLRSLALKGGVSYARLSDLEHERRKPTPRLAALYAGLKR